MRSMLFHMEASLLYLPSCHHPSCHLQQPVADTWVVAVGTWAVVVGTLVAVEDTLHRMVAVVEGIHHLPRIPAAAADPIHVDQHQVELLVVDRTAACCRCRYSHHWDEPR